MNNWEYDLLELRAEHSGLVRVMNQVCRPCRKRHLPRTIFIADILKILHAVLVFKRASMVWKLWVPDFSTLHVNLLLNRGCLADR